MFEEHQLGAGSVVCRELSRRLRKADHRITEVADKAGDKRTQISRRALRCGPEDESA